MGDNCGFETCDFAFNLSKEIIINEVSSKVTL